MAGTSRRKADPHQLIALQLVLTPQTTNGFIVGVGRGAARHLDGWFHKLLESKDPKRKSASVEWIECSTQRFGSPVIDGVRLRGK